MTCKIQSGIHLLDAFYSALLSMHLVSKYDVFLTELFCSVFIAMLLCSTNLNRNTAEGNTMCKL